MDKRKQQKIVSEHYGHKVSEWEVEQEIANLERKRDKGNLDDSQFSLASSLDLFKSA